MTRNGHSWVVLRRARIALLSFLVLICFTWATLFAIFLSHEWSHSSLFQKIVIVGLLSLYVFTAILLHLMTVALFCPWWDVVRTFAILVIHIGSSILFTHCRSSLPCRGFDTETACKELVFIIFVGCWVFSGIIMLAALCFAIALVVMAFIRDPRPVEPEAALESLPPAGTEKDCLPSNTYRVKTGSPTDKRRPSPSPSPIRTGPPVNGGELPGKSLSPDHNTFPVNSIHGEIIALEPLHPWQGLQSKDSRHRNEPHTRGGTIPSTRNAPGGSGSIGSAPQRADSFCQKFFSYFSTSRTPTHLRKSMIRPAMGGKNTPSAKVRPNRTSIFPKLQHDASSSIPLHNSPSLATMPRDRAAEYTPKAFSVLSNNPVLTPPSDDSQPSYPDHTRTTTSNGYSFRSSPANVHSKEVGPTPYVLHPSVPTPGVARFQDLSAFWGPKEISSWNNASLAAGGSNLPLVRSASQPRRTVQRSGVGTAHRASTSPVKKVPFLRRGSDEQVLDQTQWWGLVRSAATKP